jgi:hypothetical protein
MESPPNTHSAKRAYGSQVTKFDPPLPWSFPASPRALRAFLTTATGRLAHRCGPSIVSGHGNRPVRFRHFKHRMAEFLMRKFTVNLPALVLIKLNGPNIRLDHAKAKRAMSASPYLKFRMREQLCTDAKAAAVPSNPQITDPFIPRHGHADNLFC